MIFQSRSTYTAVARKKFAARIRQLRIQAQLTQEMFAEKAQVDRSYVSLIESGRANLSFDVIVRIANALKVNLPELFTF